MKKLRIFGEIWGSSVGMSLAAGCILSLVFGVGFMDNGRYFFQTLGIYTMIVGAMILLIVPVSIHQSYVPIMLSMNCRRKEIFQSFQLLKLLNWLGVALVGGLLLGSQYMFDQSGTGFGEERILFFLCACFLLCSASAGNLAASLYSRFGRIAMLIFGILCGISGGIIGFVSSFQEKKEILSLMEWFSSREDAFWVIGAAAVTMVLTLTDILVSWLILRKIEVRS